MSEVVIWFWEVFHWRERVVRPGAMTRFKVTVTHPRHTSCILLAKPKTVNKIPNFNRTLVKFLQSDKLRSKTNLILSYSVTLTITSLCRTTGRREARRPSNPIDPLSCARTGRLAAIHNRTYPSLWHFWRDWHWHPYVSREKKVIKDKVFQNAVALDLKVSIQSKSSPIRSASEFPGVSTLRWLGFHIVLAWAKRRLLFTLTADWS